MGTGVVAEFIAGNEGEGLPLKAVNFEIERALKPRLVSGIGLPNAAIEFGIAGFPNPVARLNTSEIDIVAAETESHLPCPFENLINAAALLWLVGIAAIEDDAVAGLHRAFARENNFIAADVADLADENAAFLAEAGMNQLLIVNAAEPAGVKAAGEAHLEVIEILRREERLVLSDVKRSRSSRRPRKR